MTIIFSNHTIKYEIESTVKLFIPAIRFSFLYDERNCDGDLVMTRVKTGKSFTYLYVYVRIGDRIKRMAYHIPNEKVKADKNLCEYNLCRLVYLCLSEITELTPQWGMLTGIRPVKKVIDLIEKGFSKNELFAELKNKFFVSDEKLELVYKIAKIQMPLIKTNDYKTVSLYVSIPFCPTRCSYCSFVSHSIESAKNLIPDYIKYLCIELEKLGEDVRELGLRIDTIYIGGGTPTSIEAEDLQRIMECISKNFDILSVREYNVEAGRADTITFEKLKVIKDMGATRISVNPQTLNDEVLKVIGRKHTSEQTLNAYIMARDLGFDNINMDLIAGLPTETVDSFKNTLDKVILLSPESVTIHTLTLKRSSSLYLERENHFDNPVSQMIEYGMKNLMENGYNPYYLYRQKNTVENLENTGYAKNGKESFYNIFIMDETQTILGAGCSASTKLVYSNGKITRVHNYKFPYEYINRFDELMKKKSTETKEWRDFIATI